MHGGAVTLLGKREVVSGITLVGVFVGVSVRYSPGTETMTFVRADIIVFSYERF